MPLPEHSTLKLTSPFFFLGACGGLRWWPTTVYCGVHHSFSTPGLNLLKLEQLNRAYIVHGLTQIVNLTQSLSAHLAASNVKCMHVSSPPVLAAEKLENISCKCYGFKQSCIKYSFWIIFAFAMWFMMQLSFLGNSARSNGEHDSFSRRKETIQMEHRKECLASVEEVFGSDPSIHNDFIVINFFALVRKPH